MSEETFTAGAVPQEEEPTNCNPQDIQPTDGTLQQPELSDLAPRKPVGCHNSQETNSDSWEGADDDMFPLGAKDEIPDSYDSEPGQCVALWCGGRGDISVVFLCVKKGSPQTSYLAKDLAQKFHDGFMDCIGR